MKSDKIRYEIEVEGAKGFLAPLSFGVAEAAIGFIFTQFPKKISAGEIILHSLLVDKSPTEKSDPKYKKDNVSMWWSRACLEAYKVIEALAYKTDDDKIYVEFKGKEYSCTLKKDISREVLENALSMIQPNVGNPYPLSAGRLILNDCWVEGDEEIRENDELLVPACLAAYYRIEAKEASLKKL